MNTDKKYFAFISYKREDEKFAKWLQYKLEHYHFPSNLNGRTDLPKNVRPVFRDVTDLTPGLLAENINKALNDSEWLIVVCSPRSAKSPWVCKEAQTFIDSGRADHIIPFVIEGAPFSGNSDTECYPDVLLNLIGGQELLAANINEMGRDAAAVKVVAGMFGLNFDTLWQRYNKEQKRKRFIWTCVAVFVLILSVIISVWFYRANDKISKQNVAILEQNNEIAEKNREILKSRDKLLISQSKYLASEAQKEYENGNVLKSLRLALYALPDDLDAPDRPYVFEAEAMLRECDICNDGYLSWQEENGKIKIKDINGSSSDDRKCSNVLMHDKTVMSVRYSPNGDRVVTVSADNLLNIWDLNTGKRLIEPVNLQQKVYSASYLCNGRIVAADTQNGIMLLDADSGEVLHDDKEYFNYKIRCINDTYVLTETAEEFSLWETESGEIASHPIRNDTNIVRVALNPYASNLVTFSKDSTLRVWDIKTGEQLCKSISTPEYIYEFAFSPTGKYVAGASLYKVFVWDLYTGELFYCLRHRFGINSFEFSPCGNFLVTASRDNTAKIWDIFSKDQEYEELKSKIENGSAVYTPDGQSIIYISKDGKYAILSVFPRTKELFELKHAAEVNYAKFTSDGEYVVTASNDKTARIWDAESGSSIGEPLIHDDEVYSIDESPNGKGLVTSSRDNTARTWKTDFNKSLSLSLNLSLFVVNDVSPDGNYVFVNGFTKSYLMNTYSGELVSSFPNDVENDYIRGNVFSNSGEYIMYNYSGAIYIRRTTTGELVCGPISASMFSYANFSDDENTVVVSNKHGVAFWNYKNGVKDFELPYENFLGMSKKLENGTGWLAAVSTNSSVEIWNIAKKELITTLKECTRCDFAVFSPNGSHVAIISHHGTNMTIWNVDNGEVVATIPNLYKNVNTAEFTPCGNYIVTLSNRQIIQIRDIHTGESLIKDIAHKDEIKSLHVAPYGNYVIALTEKNRIHIYSIHSGQELVKSIELGVPFKKVFVNTDCTKLIAVGENAVQVRSFPPLQELLDKYNNDPEHDWSLSEEEKEEYSLE